jgi:hypothetical protein
MCGFIFPDLAFSPTPVSFESPAKVLDIAVGKSHFVAITCDMTDSSTSTASTFVAPSSPTRCKVRVQTWGRSLAGALGLQGVCRHTSVVLPDCGATCIVAYRSNHTHTHTQQTLAKTPTIVPFFDELHATAAFAGSEQSAILTDRGHIFVWGSLTADSAEGAPVLMALDGVSNVVLGESSRLIIANDTLYAAGSGETGRTT